MEVPNEAPQRESLASGDARLSSSIEIATQERVKTARLAFRAARCACKGERGSQLVDAALDSRLTPT